MNYIYEQEYGIDELEENINYHLHRLIKLVQYQSTNVEYFNHRNLLDLINYYIKIKFSAENTNTDKKELLFLEYLLIFHFNHYRKRLNLPGEFIFNAYSYIDPRFNLIADYKIPHIQLSIGR